jgi:YHS domain-containing protein
MKKAILAFTLVAMFAAAFAGGPHKVVKAVAKTTIHCAVHTQHVVKIADALKAKNYFDYKGRRYFFCCPGCKGEFQKHPAKYAKHESLPIPGHRKPTAKPRK